MYFSATILVSLSLAIITTADFTDTNISPARLRPLSGKISQRSVPSPLDTRQTCQGTCQSCFGATFIDCPDSSILCYDPALGQPSEDCLATGSSPPALPPALPPASPSVSLPTPLTSATTSASAPASSDTRCAELYGPGNIDCSPTSCYNPDEGEVCCPNGRYCLAGQECAVIDDVSQCRDTGSSVSSIVASTSTSITRSASSVVSPTRTSIGAIGETESTTSTASRTTRTSSASSTSTSSTTTTSSSAQSLSTGAAPILSGKDTGAVAAMGVGLLALAGML